MENQSRDNNTSNIYYYPAHNVHLKFKEPKVVRVKFSAKEREANSNLEDKPIAQDTIVYFKNINYLLNKKPETYQFTISTFDKMVKDEILILDNLLKLNSQNNLKNQ